MDQRQKLGATGEELAVPHLTEDGLMILDRNWRCTSGELNIVSQESAPDYTNEGYIVPWLVLIEVRTRRGTQFGTDLQSITPRKQAKLRQLAEEYVRTYEWTGPWRIDVVGVQMNSAGRLEAIEHIRHAVTG